MGKNRSQEPGGGHEQRTWGGPEGGPDSGAGDDVDATSWKADLLDRLLAIRPDAFERLSQRLLREAGFVNVEVTRQTGDGGIDGTGLSQLSALVSLPTFFQCKRYPGSVSPGHVRDFRGAMAGRGDKGLFITTGSFTTEARRDATRDGGQPIELIDGDKLCDLLKSYEVGVRTQVRTEEGVILQPSFFDDI